MPWFTVTTTDATGKEHTSDQIASTPAGAARAAKREIPASDHSLSTPQVKRIINKTGKP